MANQADKQVEDIELHEAGDAWTDKPAPDGLDIYQPKERFIFKYFNGEKLVVADPLILYRRIQAKAAILDADMKAANFPGFLGAEQAQANLDATMRQVFKVKPLEEGGLTPTELEDLLAQFLDYCDFHKKKWNLIQTSQTETSESSQPLQEESPATRSSSDSGSTAAVSNTAVPPASPLVQESPGAASTQAWRIGQISQKA